MKKLFEYISVSALALAVVCALVFSFVSCLRSGTDADTCDETAETGGVTFPVSGEADLRKGTENEVRVFPYRTVRTGSGDENENKEYPYIFEIKNRTEFDALAKRLGSAYAEELSALGYGDAFFAENELVTVVLRETSGSIGHEVLGADEKGGIRIKRILPEEGTCDMAEWHIFVELPLDFSERVPDFYVTFCE